MVGRVLTHYRVIEKLGSGGMGEVWRAVDLRLERDVALKVLPENKGADAASQKRFLREAKSVSSLNHPNIVTVYEVDSDNGTDFIAMELVNGHTLSSLMRSAKLSVDTVLRYGIAIAEALECAHSAGIVHRDLKPRNIMVTADGRLKVLDFGLAKRTESTPVTMDEPTRTELTVAGMTAGTASYMSPEQAAGDKLDGRSDIFSLGVLLYQVLSGKLPFEGTSTTARLRNLLAHDPTPLLAAAPGTPIRLAQLVHRCLQKDPAKRPRSAAAVVTDLRAIQAAVSGRPVSRQRAWAAALIATLALGGTFFLLYQRRHAGPDSLPGDPADLTRDARSLMDRYDRPQNIDRALGEVNQAIHTDPNYAPAYAELAEIQVRQAMSSRDPQLLKSAQAYAEKAIALDRDLAAGYVALGGALNESGEKSKAAAAFGKAIALDPRSAAGHIGLAKSKASAGDPSGAQAEFMAALRLAPNNWQAHSEQGIFFYRNSRYSDAIASFEAARFLAGDQIGVLRNLAAAYHMADRTDDAASTLQRALEIRPSGALYNNLGTLRFFQGRYLDALPLMRKAVELDPNNYLSWGNLGDAYRWTPGNRDQAAGTFREAVRLIREKLKNSPTDPELVSSLAMYLAKSGDRPSALAELDHLSKLPPKTGSAWYRGALAYEISGNRSTALSWIAQALASGYSVREIRNDPDLLNLRETKDYRLAEDNALPKETK